MQRLRFPDSWVRVTVFRASWKGPLCGVECELQIQRSLLSSPGLYSCVHMWKWMGKMPQGTGLLHWTEPRPHTHQVSITVDMPTQERNTREWANTHRTWTLSPAYVHAHAQSCPTLCNPMDYSPPGSSIHGIFQARILEWVATSSSRGSSRPRDQTCICIGRQILCHSATWLST